MLQIATWEKPALKAGQIYGANLKPLVHQLPRLSCEICVIVPVRDEAENLETTLLALTNQIDLNGQPLDKNRYEIIVLANNCSDHSAEIARNFARSQPNLVLHVAEITLKRDRAHIGWVRKILMDEAYRRFKSIGRDFGVIASTDGDTRVAPTWLAATLAEIQGGADAVGGRIITESLERQTLDNSTRLYFLRSVGYSYLISQLEVHLDPDTFDLNPRHYQHYGASLAVTAQMYAQVGGLPPLPSSEDVALYQALIRFDARFRHSPAVQVATSARVLGRAKAGLADRLAELKVMGQKHQSLLVESASLLEARFRLRRHLRDLWQRKQQGAAVSPKLVIILARFLDIDRDLLLELVMRSPTFGLLVEQIGYYQQNNQQIAQNWQKVTIQQAIADLRAMVKKFSQVNYYFLKQQELEYILNLNSLEQIQPILLLPQSF
jgi:glycosyltransferase involved in cell wall biosynthesis